MARAIMLQGTGSDVGKTVLVAGLCRALRRRGIRVAPFKPQNMSNNAAVAGDADGGEGEIGRAQWLQALACGLPPSVHMNPVLLKPQSETGSQVVVRGKVRGTARGRDYLALKATLLGEVLASFEVLKERADLIVVEGAGSPAEVNLRAGDIANMGFARAADVPVVLVGDIDRGGVIASLVGTHAVLDEADRAMVAAYLINKFRGDVSLFDDGLRVIERHTGWPGLGVVPWLTDAARLPAEDSVALERMASGGGGTLRIAVPVLPRIANFDDLDPLRAEPGVSVHMVRAGGEWPVADVVLLPGSKATLHDLAALRAEGWDRAILAHHARGGCTIGLCGGYQMLGRAIADPHGIEDGGEAEGLGLLDVATVLEPVKTTRVSEAVAVQSRASASGYEIHCGATDGPDRGRPVFTLAGEPEGATSADGRVWGSYLHGAFDSGAFRAAWLRSLGMTGGGADHREAVEAALDAIAVRLEGVLDVDRLIALAR